MPESIETSRPRILYDNMAKLERLMDPPNAILRIGGRLRSADGPMVGSIIGGLGANARLLVRLDDDSRFESA